MQTRDLLDLRWLAAAILAVSCLGCGDGNWGGDGDDPGGGSGDRLYLGTVAGSGGASGSITVVVHDDSTAEAKIITAGGEPLSCQVATPEGSCDGSDLACTSVCCPSDFPYYCASTSQCYVTVEAADAECGAGCEACGGAPPDSSGGGTTEVYLDGQVADGSLDASGEGWSIDGETDGDSLDGNYTDDVGGDGYFAAEDATDGEVSRFCGTYSGDDGGTWNLQTAGSSVSGSFAGSLAGGTLEGSLSGSTIDMSFSGVDVSGSANGTVSGGSVDGTWATGDGSYSGGWSGSTAACNGPTTTSADDCCTMLADGRTSCPIHGC